MHISKEYIPSSVIETLSTLEKSGHTAYLVGGCVRDSILQKKPKDWDIATSATPETIQNLFSKTVYTNTFGTVSVIYEDCTDLSSREIQVTPYRQDGSYADFRHPDSVTFTTDIAIDLSRRDFTINSLAYCVSQETFVDLYGGLRDIDQKVLRTVGDSDQRFTEDPLRILRGIRFSAELGFSLEYKTLESMSRNAILLEKISPDRIRDEFSKIIKSPDPYLGMSLLAQLKLLEKIIPEFCEGIGCEQKGEHVYDVFQHLLHALKHASDKNFSFHVKLASLFHDIGKPRTRDYSSKKDKYTFYGHEVVGARMTFDILKRLNFSRETIDTVVKLVRYHMFFSDTEQITLSAVRRLIVNVGEDLVWDLMKVRECDRVGMRKKESSYRLRKYFSLIDQALRDPISVKMLALNGKDLIEEFHVKPGPLLGSLLNALLEEVLEESSKNTRVFLSQRVQELLLLPEKKIHLLGSAGRVTREIKEKEEIYSIQKKYCA